MAKRVKKPITQLSKLGAGKDYLMTADEVHCSLSVVIPGTSPTCILYGDFDARGDDVANARKHDDVPVLIRLIGWAPFGYTSSDDMDPAHLGDGLLVFDKKPIRAFLVGIWMTPEAGHRVDLIACEPVIIER